MYHNFSATERHKMSIKNFKKAVTMYHCVFYHYYSILTRCPAHNYISVSHLPPEFPFLHFKLANFHFLNPFPFVK